MQSFYKDVGALCGKYGLHGIAGLWISAENKDNTFAVFDPTDSTNSLLLKHVVVRLNTMLRDAGWKNPTITKGFNAPDEGEN